VGQAGEKLAKALSSLRTELVISPFFTAPRIAFLPKEGGTFSGRLEVPPPRLDLSPLACVEDNHLLCQESKHHI